MAEIRNRKSSPSVDDYVAITADGKIKKKIIREGWGKAPQLQQYVRVHYTGMLTDTTIFDSSKKRGIAFVFQLGAGEVIRGWDICVATMRVGEICVVEIDSEYGYREKRVGKIPPNSKLHFNIELLSSTTWNPVVIIGVALYSAIFIGIISLFVAYYYYYRKLQS